MASTFSMFFWWGMVGLFEEKPLKWHVEGYLVFLFRIRGIICLYFCKRTKDTTPSATHGQTFLTFYKMPQLILQSFKAIKHEACPCNTQCLHHNVKSLEVESFSNGQVREASSLNFRLLVIGERLVRVSSLFFVLLLKTGSASTHNKHQSCILPLNVTFT